LRFFALKTALDLELKGSTLLNVRDSKAS